LPDPLAHYRAIIVALARLSGTQRSGRMGEAAARAFPLDRAQLLASDRNRYRPDQLARRAQRVANFVAAFPRLFPERVAQAEFLARFVAEAPRYLRHETAIKLYLHARPAFIALCHFNANIDNAWFWRGVDGTLECGLIDWGRAGQMSLALALWGCLSAAQPELWNDHLGELLTLFAAEYARAGGPGIAVAQLAIDLDLHVMMMGLTWLMDAPHHILAAIGDPAQLTGPADPLLEAHETARVQLNILANVLDVWARHDLGKYLRGTDFSALAG
jgi:hypothetical protein